MHDLNELLQVDLLARIVVKLVSDATELAAVDALDKVKLVRVVRVDVVGLSWIQRLVNWLLFLLLLATTHLDLLLFLLAAGVLVVS